MSDFSFTATEVEEKQQGDFYEEKIPDGEYRVQITETNYSPNKKKEEDPDQVGAGDWLMIEYEVVSNGKQKGQSVKQYYNVVHTNETAVEIAERDLSRLCKVINIEGFKNRDQLLGKKLIIKTQVKGDFVNIVRYSAVPHDEPLVTAEELATEEMEEPPF